MRHICEQATAKLLALKALYHLRGGDDQAALQSAQEAVSCAEQAGTGGGPGASAKAHYRKAAALRASSAQGGDLDPKVIPTPSRVLDRISHISSPFFPVFCAFSPPRRDGSNELQARTQGQETAGTGVQTAGNTVSPG